jgi:hypothetical protein
MVFLYSTVSFSMESSVSDKSFPSLKPSSDKLSILCKEIEKYIFSYNYASIVHTFLLSLQQKYEFMAKNLFQHMEFTITDFFCKEVQNGNQFLA